VRSLSRRGPALRFAPVNGDPCESGGAPWQRPLSPPDPHQSTRALVSEYPVWARQKITHLGYAAVASPALQSGQVQAGRLLTPLRGTAFRLFLLASLRSNSPTLRPSAQPRHPYALAELRNRPYVLGSSPGPGPTLRIFLCTKRGEHQRRTQETRNTSRKCYGPAGVGRLDRGRANFAMRGFSEVRVRLCSITPYSGRPDVLKRP
jgi:hypothetical protein